MMILKQIRYVAVAKCNVHGKHTKALFKVKELKEAEDKKAQLLKEHIYSKMHTEIQRKEQEERKLKGNG